MLRKRTARESASVLEQGLGARIYVIPGHPLSHWKPQVAVLDAVPDSAGRNLAKLARMAKMG
jgi:hypothetical protein